MLAVTANAGGDGQWQRRLTVVWQGYVYMETSECGRIMKFARLVTRRDEFGELVIRGSDDWANLTVMGR